MPHRVGLRVAVQQQERRAGARAAQAQALAVRLARLQGEAVEEQAPMLAPPRRREKRVAPD
jgi:hypothetical protein